LRVLIWLAGCAGFVYAIERMGLWREAAAFAVLVAAFCWIVGAGCWAARIGRTRARPSGPSAADKAALEQMAESIARRVREERAAK
jgi:hypothetical protein